MASASPLVLDDRFVLVRKMDSHHFWAIFLDLGKEQNSRILFSIQGIQVMVIATERKTNTGQDQNERHDRTNAELSARGTAAITGQIHEHTPMSPKVAPLQGFGKEVPVVVGSVHVGHNERLVLHQHDGQIICRKGDPQLHSELSRVRAWTAKSIIIIANQGNAEQADTNTVRVLLSLRGLQTKLKGHIVTEIRDVDVVPVTEMIGGEKVEPIVMHDIIGE